MSISIFCLASLLDNQVYIKSFCQTFFQIDQFESINLFCGCDFSAVGEMARPYYISPGVIAYIIHISFFQNRH